jgi:pimeloyl-ACP methyl ester carboxylesterase
MIPSLGRRAADFDDLAQQLASAGYCAARIEPRGAGKSVGPMEGVTLHDLADEVAAVIHDLGGGKPAVVIGHAFGQRVGRMLATDHVDLVRALIMLAAGGKVPSILPDWGRIVEACFNFSLPEAERMRSVQSAFFAPGNDPSVWRDGWEPAVAKMQNEAWRAVALDTWWSAGSAPVLIVQGLQDVIAVPENGRLLRAELGSRVELVEIDGAGHAMLPERPAEIASAILEFLRRA